MSTTLTPAAARDAVAAAVRRIVPDADLADLADDAPLRDTFELDSLDFLSFVELLSGATGLRIEEADYPRLATTADCVDLLTERSAR